MRIAYVINSLEGGGAASPVPAIVEVLRSAGAEVALFALTCRDARALPAIAAAGIEIVVRDGGERDHLAALRWLDREVRHWCATHLWTSLSRATLLGQIVGQRRALPVVSWQHNAFLKPWNRRLLRWRQHRSAIWVADSEAVRRLTAERLGVPDERLMSWPIFRADPAAPRAVCWRPGEPLRIGSLGRLHSAKGYDVLAAALARLEPKPPVEIVIGGEGAQRSALAAAGFVLPGYVDPQRLLAGLHLYVQPSRREGFGIAAHEAMQAGLPVIASAVGELAHSVGPGVSGWLVAPDDIDALVAALRDALSRPEQLAAMGEAGRAHVLDRFGPDRFAEAGRAVVERLRAL